MKKLAVGFVLMVVMSMSSALVYAQQSVAGPWTMSVQGMSLRMVLAQEGEKISGTLESPHGPISLSGSFYNGKLTLSGSSAEPQVIHVSGTANLSADGSLAGNLSVEQMEMTFTAVRAAGK
jgi:hypothetical protein